MQAGTEPALYQALLGKLGQGVKMKGRDMKGTITGVPYPDGYWGVTVVVKWSHGAVAEHTIEELELPS